MIIDTHCHLAFEPLAGDADAVLRATRERGVSAVISCAYAPTDWPLQAEFAAKPGVFIAQGVHPWVADVPWQERELRAYLQHARCVAVGEVGLDYGPTRPPREVQRQTLGRQLQLAAELGLPVILHCHRAFDDLLAMLDDYPHLRGGLHGYGRGIELAERCVARGLLLGFGAALMREDAARCRKAAQALPLSSLLVESDAPASRWPQDAISRPSRVADVVVALARLRGEDAATIAEGTTQNARELYAIEG